MKIRVCTGDDWILLIQGIIADFCVELLDSISQLTNCQIFKEDIPGSHLQDCTQRDFR
jgi:hypothetical protein